MSPLVVAALLAALPHPSLWPQDTPSSRVVAVTVHPSGASVVRVASVPPGAARVTLTDLPATLELETLRVRARGAEVQSVDARRLLRAASPSARIEELRLALAAARDERRALVDEGVVLGTQAAFVAGVGAANPTSDARAGEPVADLERLEAWGREHDWLAETGLALAQARLRLEQRRAAVEERVRLAEQALGRVGAPRPVPAVEVAIELADPEADGSVLELEYFVPEADWTPTYELRADEALDAVELVFRARVRQQSGEDWEGVTLHLSTSSPVRGTQGPELVGLWLGLRGAGLAKALDGLGYSGGPEASREPAASAQQVSAAVQLSGTSVRYRLPRRETLTSRSEATTVFVGRARLAAAPERVCVPAVDPTVWLRSRARNTSPWTLLAGEAAVYYGADYLGTSRFDAVQPDAPLLLHLGPDPRFTVERIALAEATEGPGFFGSRASERRSWRVRVENHGATTTRADGAAAVLVQESLPRSRDSRVQVRLDDPSQRPLASPRWARLREERGVVTWSLLVPDGDEATLDYGVELKYPATRELTGGRP